MPKESMIFGCCLEKFSGKSIREAFNPKTSTSAWLFRSLFQLEWMTDSS